MAVDGVKSNNQEAHQANKAKKRELKDREDAMIRKHNAEMARLNRQHKAQIDALQEQYNKATNDLKTNSQSALTEKDKRYQDEMNEMREMQRKNYSNTVNEKDAQYENLRRTTDEEVDRTKERSEFQLETLRDNLENEIKNKKKEYENSMTEARKTMAESLERERDQLTNRNESDKKHLRDNRNRDVAGEQEAFRRMKMGKENEIKDLEAELALTKKTLSEKFEDEVDRLNSTYETRTTAQKQAYDEGLNEVRNETKEAQIARNENFSAAYRNLRNEARARQMTEVAGLERKIADLKHQNQESLYNSNRLNKVEKQHLMDALKENLKAMEDSQKKAAEQNKVQTYASIKTLNEKHNEHNARQINFYKDKINTQALVFDDAYRQQQGEMQATIKNKDVNAKVDQAKTRSLYTNELHQADERLRLTLQNMKHEHEDEMKDLKMKSQREKNDNILVAQDLMRDAETKYNQRMAETIRRYEEKTSTLALKGREGQIEEKNRSERLLKETHKQTDMKLKMQAMQYEAKMAQLREQHEHSVQNLKSQLEANRMEVATRAASGDNSKKS